MADRLYGLSPTVVTGERIGLQILHSQWNCKQIQQSRTESRMGLVQRFSTAAPNVISESCGSHVNAVCDRFQ